MSEDGLTRQEQQELNDYVAQVVFDRLEVDLPSTDRDKIVNTIYNKLKNKVDNKKFKEIDKQLTILKRYNYWIFIIVAALYVIFFITH